MSFNVQLSNNESIFNDTYLNNMYTCEFPFSTFSRSYFFLPEYIFGHYLGFTIGVVLSRLNADMTWGRRMCVLYYVR